MRLLVKLAKEPQGWFIYPGGQSGNPGSPYYTNFVEPWRRGQYIPMTIDANKVQAESFCTLTLHPAL